MKTARPIAVAMCVAALSGCGEDSGTPTEPVRGGQRTAQTATEKLTTTVRDGLICLNLSDEEGPRGGGCARAAGQAQPKVYLAEQSGSTTIFGQVSNSAVRVHVSASRGSTNEEGVLKKQTVTIDGVRRTIGIFAVEGLSGKSFTIEVTDSDGSVRETAVGGLRP